MLSLQLAVGLTFADASVAGHALEGVHLGEALGFHESRYLFCDVSLLILMRGVLADALGREEKDDLSANGGTGDELCLEFADKAAEKFFVELGQFAGDDDVLRGAEDGGDVCQCAENAVGGFVEDMG